MTFSRLQTSKSRLNIRWQNAPNADLQNIVTMDDMLQRLAKKSRNKPLLIQRTTDQRDPKVKKLLDAALKSERFSLASQWFHCVKIGDEVLVETHPLHPFFKGKNPASLVMMTADAKKHVSFLGTTSQKVKWSPIASVLKASYKKNATSAVKGLEKLLCQFDTLDGKKNELNAQLKRAQKSKNKSKINSIKKKLAAQEKDRKKAFEEEAKLRELQLRAASE